MKKSSAHKSTKTTGSQFLGHGDHWAALGLEGETLNFFLPEVARAATVVNQFPPPWPEEYFETLVQMELPQPEIIPALILGKSHKDEGFTVLSAFPILGRTTTWTLEIGKVLDSYGPFEGVVRAEADTGHSLQWFAPRFGKESVEWKRGGRVRVGLTGLALSIERFDADAIIIKEGPRVEERRIELRTEGRYTETDDPNLSMTYRTEELRTLFSSHHDHHEFVGRVLRVAKVKCGSLFKGWRMEVECRHDDHGTGASLPVYVFPPALAAGYTPKKGDLIQGMLWLQGTYLESVIN
jgi:hypothetical protein